LAHSLLGGLFTWCVAKRKLDRSPVAGLEPPQAATARDRVLEDGELALFWKATETLSPWHRACLRLLLLTGQRLREISDLRDDEIKGDVIALAGQRTKNKKAHVIPLSALAREVLAGVPRVEDCPFVFSMGRVPISNWHRVKLQLDAEMHGDRGQDQRHADAVEDRRAEEILAEDGPAEIRVACDDIAERNEEGENDRRGDHRADAVFGREMDLRRGRRCRPPGRSARRHRLELRPHAERAEGHPLRLAPQMAGRSRAPHERQRAGTDLPRRRRVEIPRG
jgi:hypothetical protein